MRETTFVDGVAQVACHLRFGWCDSEGPRAEDFNGCGCCNPCEECDGYGMVECECECGAMAMIEHSCPRCKRSGVSSVAAKRAAREGA